MEVPEAADRARFFPPVAAMTASARSNAPSAMRSVKRAPCERGGSIDATRASQRSSAPAAANARAQHLEHRGGLVRQRIQAPLALLAPAQAVIREEPEHARSRTRSKACAARPPPPARGPRRTPAPRGRSRRCGKDPRSRRRWRSCSARFPWRERFCPRARQTRRRRHAPFQSGPRAPPARTSRPRLRRPPNPMRRPL